MATLTVQAARTEVNRRIGPWVALADMDSALARAARMTGLSPAATMSLVDADLLTLESVKYDQFLDVAELRTWMSILGNATESGLRDIGLDDSLSDIRSAAMAAIKDLKASVKEEYGVGLATLEIGVINLNFAAGADDETEEF